MADAAAPTDEEMRRALGRAEASLVGLMAHEGVTLSHQYKVVNAGYTTGRLFANYEEERTAVRTGLSGLLAVQVTTDEGRLALGKLVTVWETLREQAKVDHRLRAEHRLGGTVRPVAATERQQMRRVLRTGRSPRSRGT